MSEGLIGKVVRGSTWGLTLVFVGAMVLLYFFDLWVEDDRSMTLRIHPATRQNIALKLTGEIETPPGKEGPRVQFPGLEGDGTIMVHPGRVLDVPVKLEMPAGLWRGIAGQIATGDLQGVVHIEPVKATPEFVGRDVPLTVHVKSIWETWRGMVFVFGGGILIFAFLAVISLLVLEPPSGRLQVIHSESGEPFRSHS